MRISGTDFFSLRGSHDKHVNFPFQAFATVVQAEDEENEDKQKKPDKLLQYPC